jgi:hypothetical protein
MRPRSMATRKARALYVDVEGPGGFRQGQPGAAAERGLQLQPRLDHIQLGTDEVELLLDVICSCQRCAHGSWILTAPFEPLRSAIKRY